MNASTSHPASTSTRRADPSARSLLIGVGSFNLLKRSQERLPTPRLDMRYLVEGALFVCAKPEVKGDWLRVAQAALRDQLNATTRSGTGTTSERGAEGATARNQETSSRAKPFDPSCKSLLLGEDAFTALKLLQNGTHSPRLEMRYLVEGAITFVHERASIQAAWVQAARQMLQTHLAVLEQQPVDPFFLEIQA